jgi:hypothetical protein
MPQSLIGPGLDRRVEKLQDRFHPPAGTCEFITQAYKSAEALLDAPTLALRDEAIQLIRQQRVPEMTKDQLAAFRLWDSVLKEEARKVKSPLVPSAIDWLV